MKLRTFTVMLGLVALALPRVGEAMVPSADAGHGGDCPAHAAVLDVAPEPGAPLPVDAGTGGECSVSCKISCAVSATGGGACSPTPLASRRPESFYRSGLVRAPPSRAAAAPFRPPRRTDA